MKAIQKIANADLVVVVERLPVGDLLVVDEGAVPAPHVFEIELALHAQDAGVLAAYGKVVGWKDDVATGVAAENDAVLLQREALLGVLSLQDEQISHDPTSAGIRTPPGRHPNAGLRIQILRICQF